MHHMEKPYTLQHKVFAYIYIYWFDHCNNYEIYYNKVVFANIIVENQIME